MTSPESPAPAPAREPIFNVPTVVLLMIALMVLIHAVLEFGMSAQASNEFLLMFSFIPARYDAGVLASEPWTLGWGPAIWSFVTHAFIHSNFTHLFFNLAMLLAFGAPVARRFGAARFVVFFLVTAAAGAAVQLAVDWGELILVIGASASISALTAAALRFVFQPGGPLERIDSADGRANQVPAASFREMLQDRRIVLFMVFWFGLNLLFGFRIIPFPGLDGRIAWEAHIGGFLVGLLAFPLFDPIRAPGKTGSGEPPPPTPTIH